MDAKPQPPQYGLRSLFKLTTWAAVLSAVYAVLPEGVQKVIVFFPLAWAFAFLELLILLSVVALCRRLWRAVRRVVGPPRFHPSDVHTSAPWRRAPGRG